MRFIRFAKLAVRHAPVVIGKGVSGINFDRLVQILDSPLVLLQCDVRNPSVVEGKGVLRVKFDDLVQILNSPLVLLQSAVRNPYVVVSNGVLWVEPDGLVQILNGPLVLPVRLMVKAAVSLPGSEPLASVAVKLTVGSVPDPESVIV